MSNKLLLADDSITIRKVVGIIFANEDYALTVVDNGNAALEKAREIIPDIILADVLMPGNTGYEVCVEIRRDPALKHIPLILLTGAFEPFDEEKARQSGADDFITKPFESQQLIEKVKKLIALGKGRKTSQAVLEPVAAVAAQLSTEQFTVPSPEVPVLGEMGGVFLHEETAAEKPAFQLDQLSMEEEAAADTSFQTDQLSVPEEIPEEPSLQSGQLSTADETTETAPEDDLWDVFTLDEVAEDEAANFEAVPEEDAGEPFSEDETLGEYSFAEEEETDTFAAGPETAGAASPLAAEMFDHLGEEPSLTGKDLSAPEPDTGGVFEFAAEPKEESFFVSGLDESPTVTEPAEPEFELQFDTEEEQAPVIPPVGAPVMDESFDFGAETEEPASVVSGFDEAFSTPTPAVPEVELQFAPEEEYVPVIPPVEPVAPPVTLSPAVQGAPALSEEQLASLVERISRDIIEKIAWEVVPDMAETLIRDEIRKLKEGLRG